MLSSNLDLPPGYLAMKIVCVYNPHVCLGRTLKEEKRLFSLSGDAYKDETIKLIYFDSGMNKTLAQSGRSQVRVLLCTSHLDAVGFPCFVERSVHWIDARMMRSNRVVGVQANAMFL